MKIKSILNLMIVQSKRILLFKFSNKIPIQTSNTASFKTLWYCMMKLLIAISDKIDLRIRKYFIKRVIFMK